MAPHGDDRGEPPRVALDRQVVGGGDEDGAPEVRAVGELVQKAGELLLRRREAHVDHVEPLLDRPAQAGEQDRAAARVAGAEHADADQAAPRRNRAHDSGAGRAVPAEVALLVLLDDRLVVFAHADRDRPLDVADERVAALDPAVEDADADTRALAVAERPVARDLLGPAMRERDLLDGVGRQAPRRDRLTFRFPQRRLEEFLELHCRAHVALDLQLAGHVGGGRVQVAAEQLLEVLLGGRDRRVGSRHRPASRRPVRPGRRPSTTQLRRRRSGRCC